MTTKRKLVNVRLDPELWHKAHIAAVTQGIHLQDWITQAIEKKLEEGK